MNYKYYLRRFAAAIIDIISISLIMWIYGKLKSGTLDLKDENIPSYIFIPFFYLYYILSELVFRTTIGKRIFKLRVNSNGKFFFFKVILRNVLNLIELVIPIIYLIPILITGLAGARKPRKIGDLIAGTTIE